MRNTSRILLCAVLTALTGGAQAETAAPAPGGDSRLFVEMPAEAQQLMRQDMLSHLATLDAIVAALAGNDLKTAADQAEQQLGRASMGKHRATGMGPGRFMPLEMRNLAWSMHDAADDFAVEARKGDMQSALTALRKITSSCVSCHAVYRTR